MIRFRSAVVRGIAALMFALTGSNPSVAQTKPLHGLNFGAYIDGQDPNFGVVVPIQQLESRLSIIAPYTGLVRGFGSTHGLENIAQVGSALGLTVYQQAWIGSDLAANALELASLIQIGQSGKAAALIVGSEALLRGDVSETQLIGYINDVKAAVPGVPVAYSDTYGTLMSHPNVIAAVDLLLPTIYPYWEGIAVQDAVAAIANHYDQVVAAAGGKPVMIGETGWPSGGTSLGAAVPSPENQRAFLESFLAWARASDTPYLYFSAFDEAWKSAYEGPTGAHWGLLDSQGLWKPGVEAIVTGVPEPHQYLTMALGLIIILAAVRKRRG